MSDNNKQSYLNLVNEKIELANLLYNLPKEKQDIVKQLIEKRNRIRESNSIFAEYKINKINKKINKLKSSKD